MPERRALPEALREGRRSIDGDDGVAIVADWQWWPRPQRWALHLRLSHNLETQRLIQERTQWFLTAEERYPRGSVLLLPAKDGGIKRTFWHQSYNSPGNDDRPWRDGHLCLDLPWFTLDRAYPQHQPRTASGLIRWYVQRALYWLRTAEKGELVRPGDPWELPAVPSRADDPAIVANAENAATFLKWQAMNAQSGLATLCRPAVNPKLLLITDFRTANGESMLHQNWGTWAVEGTGSDEMGLWLRLPRVPVLPPWHTPSTWGELRQVLGEYAIDFDAALRPLLVRLRDRKPHVLLLGFPIPEFYADADVRIHWHACRLKPLASGKLSGFRQSNESTWWQRDRMTTLGDTAEIQWLTAENWSVEQLATRGRFSVNARKHRWLLLGAGALGSAVGELLVRAGVNTLLTVDGKALSAGNLVRHTLDLSAVGTSKAMALCRRLNLTSVHAEVAAWNGNFPTANLKACPAIEESDMVIDCTGIDAMLEELSLYSWPAARRFVSLSLGMRARRLFCFSSEGSAFPLKDFRAMIRPYLVQERANISEQDFPREGLGCWHPIFPARVDDLWLLAAAAVKELERLAAADGPLHSELIVYEQQFDDETFVGIRRIST